jgi:hypothetical protein
VIVLDIIALVVALVALAFGVLAVLRSRTAEDHAREAVQRADRAGVDAETSGQESARALERSSTARDDAAQALDRATAAAQDAAQARNQSAAASRDAARAIEQSRRAQAGAEAVVAEVLGRAAIPSQADVTGEAPGAASGADADPDDRRAEGLIVNMEGARWRLERVKGGTWLLRNTGSVTAHSALLSDATQPPKYIRPDEVIPRDVPPHDHLQFRAAPTRGAPPPRVRVTWREDGDASPHAYEATLVVE